MKTKRSSYVFVTVCLAALLIVSMLVAGCTSNGTTTTVARHRCSSTQAGCAPAHQRSCRQLRPESMTLTGSTTVLPIAQAVADAYMQAHPEANIQVSGGGSGVGIQAIINKKVDIGMSSAECPGSPEGTGQRYEYHHRLPTMVLPLSSTRQTRSRISPLTRSSRSTAEISPPGHPSAGHGIANSNNQIVLVGRDSSSGTRTYFDRLRNAGCQRFPDHARSTTRTVQSSRKSPRHPMRSGTSPSVTSRPMSRHSRSAGKRHHDRPHRCDRQGQDLSHPP